MLGRVANVPRSRTTNGTHARTHDVNVKSNVKRLEHGRRCRMAINNASINGHTIPPSPAEGREMIATLSIPREPMKPNQLLLLLLLVAYTLDWHFPFCSIVLFFCCVVSLSFFFILFLSFSLSLFTGYRFVLRLLVEMLQDVEPWMK